MLILPEPVPKFTIGVLAWKVPVALENVFTAPVKVLLNGKISVPTVLIFTLFPPLLIFTSLPLRKIVPLSLGFAKLAVGSLIPIVLISNISFVVPARLTLNLSLPSSTPDETFSDIPTTLAKLCLTTAESYPSKTNPPISAFAEPTVVAIVLKFAFAPNNSATPLNGEEALTDNPSLFPPPV